MMRLGGAWFALCRLTRLFGLVGWLARAGRKGGSYGAPW